MCLTYYGRILTLPASISCRRGPMSGFCAQKAAALGARGAPPPPDPGRPVRRRASNYTGDPGLVAVDAQARHISVNRDAGADAERLKLSGHGPISVLDGRESERDEVGTEGHSTGSAHQLLHPAGRKAHGRWEEVHR